MELLDSIIRPTVLYGSKVWGSILLEEDWAKRERVQVLFLCCIIRCKTIVSQNVIQVKFVAHPFGVEAIFGLVSLPH